MGQGKTPTMAKVLAELRPERVLIIGVKDTFSQWAGTVKALIPGATVRHLDGTKKGAEAFAEFEWGTPGVYFISHQMLTRRDHETITDSIGEKVHIHQEYWASLPECDMIIADEVHLLSRRGAKGQATLHSLPLTADGWKFALSGTFYGNQVTNAWAPTFWLWPEQVPESYWYWLGKWCEQVPVVSKSGRQVRTPKGQPAKKVVGWKRNLATSYVESLPCYIRGPKVADVPDPEVIEVELSSTQAKVYDQLEKQSLAWLDGKPWVLELPISQRTALKTVCLAEPTLIETGDPDNPYTVDFDMDAASAKYNALVELLRSDDWAGEPVVIGTDRKKYANLLVARLRRDGFDVAGWTGDVLTAERQQIKDDWIAGKYQVLVTVMASFGTGVDGIQHRKPRAVVISSPEGNPTLKQQWLFRTYRGDNQTKGYRWAEIVARGTLDVGVFRNVELQAQMISRSLDVTPVSP